MTILWVLVIRRDRKLIGSIRQKITGLKVIWIIVCMCVYFVYFSLSIVKKETLHLRIPSRLVKMLPLKMYKNACAYFNLFVVIVSRPILRRERMGKEGWKGKKRIIYGRTLYVSGQDLLVRDTWQQTMRPSVYTMFSKIIRYMSDYLILYRLVNASLRELCTFRTFSLTFAKFSLESLWSSYANFEISRKMLRKMLQ